MDEIKMKMLLIEAIDKVTEEHDDVFNRAWYGEKEIERMADAALAVHMASIEGQKMTQENQ